MEVTPYGNLSSFLSRRRRRFWGLTKPFCPHTRYLDCIQPLKLAALRRKPSMAPYAHKAVYCLTYSLERAVSPWSALTFIAPKKNEPWRTSEDNRDNAQASSSPRKAQRHTWYDGRIHYLLWSWLSKWLPPTPRPPMRGVKTIFKALYGSCKGLVMSFRVLDDHSNSIRIMTQSLQPCKVIMIDLTTSSQV